MGYIKVKIAIQMQQQRKITLVNTRRILKKKLDSGVRLTYGNMVQPLTDREATKTLDDIRVSDSDLN